MGIFDIFKNQRSTVQGKKKLSSDVRTSNSSTITIGVSRDNNDNYELISSQRDNEIPIAEDQNTAEDVCRWFVEKLTENGKIERKFRIEQRAQEYLTLLYGANDFMRVKYTRNAKWISLDTTDAPSTDGANRQRFIDSGLFEVNEKTRHWKSYISGMNDLPTILPYALLSCYVVLRGYEVPLRESEQIIAERLKSIFIEAGADPYYIRFYEYSDHASFDYVQSRIEIKTYKSKKPRLSVEKDVGKKAGIKVYKSKDMYGYYDLDSEAKYEPLKSYAKLIINSDNVIYYLEYYKKYPESWDR